MTEIETLQAEFIKLKEAKSKAVTEQQFELSATLRDREKIIIEKVDNLVKEIQSVITYANLHLENIASTCTTST